MAENIKIFLKKEFGMIIGRTNGKLDVSILKNNDTTNEIQFVKCWFKTEYFKMIEIFINDLPFSFNKYNGGKVEYNILNMWLIQNLK